VDATPERAHRDGYRGLHSRLHCPIPLRGALGPRSGAMYCLVADFLAFAFSFLLLSGMDYCDL
jgi:hypothetical protein